MSPMKVMGITGVFGVAFVCFFSSSGWSQPEDATVTAIPGSIPYQYGLFTLSPGAEEKVPLLEQIDGGQVLIASL